MKKFLIVLFGLLFLLIVFVAHTLISTGFFRNINNSENYEIIATIPLKGAEDFSISYDEQFMIISQDDRAARRNDRVRTGDLYYLDLTDSSYFPINLTAHLPFPFYPHGISLLKLDSGRYQILAVNHAGSGHSIEKFELQADSLVHIQTYKSETMNSPNDVIALDERRFYFTNDHGYSSKAGIFLENYLALRISNTVLFDGMYKEVAGGIAYANGLNISRDRSQLIVASPRHFALKYYDINTDGSLTFDRNLDVGTGVDNIELDQDGNLWLGCHPSLLAFTAYARGSKSMAPSEVVVVRSGTEVLSTFQNDGSLVSASSVAAPFADLLFIGTVMDDELLVLKMK